MIKTDTSSSAAAASPFLAVRGLKKRFGENVVLDGVALDVPRGRLLAVVGKSGTGKSVLLKCLAGVLAPDAGEVRFDGAPLSDRDPKALAAFRARCSYLFQGNALLDSLTAWENVALPLEQTTLLPKCEIRARVADALARLELADHAHRHPAQMSGGMQKRLALARAIVTRPQLVLFDEPTAGLDPIRRNAVFTLIAKARRDFDFTAVVVTHDLPEALVACDQVAFLDEGRIRFAGPASVFATAQDEALVAFRDSGAALAHDIAVLRT
jgi:phospholipid/cholesterol/gamma-HCH transport system ATP-binding protein